MAIDSVGARLGWASLALGAAVALTEPSLPIPSDGTNQGAAPTPTPLWSGLLQLTPVPNDLPLPADDRTPIDGTFAVHDPSPPQWWSCLRCADYRPSGGTWRLRFDRGVLRILYPVTGWRNLASFEVAGETLEVFNDPICPWDRGTYRWHLTEGRLDLEAVEDSCSFGLRAENLSRGTWSSCAPPDNRAAVSDAWEMPPGCEQNNPGLSTPSPSNELSVSIHPGDVRRSAVPPQLLVAANSENLIPSDGLEISRSEGVVPYGLNLILWEGGPWAEATVDIPADAIGVQFWGPATMGAGRVMFDGQEIWRGRAADLGSSLVQYGGYVEVSGFAPGRHRIRVEHLDLEGRPLTILFFGVR